MMAPKQAGLETLALHAGQTPDGDFGSRAVPIYQTTSYCFRDAAHAAGLFNLEEFGHIYSRLSNPTVEVLENRLAALHGGTAALCTASGMAAIAGAILTLAEAGDNIVTGENLYGGTHTLFQHTLRRLGIEARFVDSSDPAAFSKAADERTRCFYTESIGNPRCNIDDLDAIAAEAHKVGVPFVVDNTVAAPPIYNPFDHGADLIVYSLTKIIGGHGTSIGGAMIEKGDFDWRRGGRFPQLTEPDPSYHGISFWEKFGNHPDAVLPGVAFIVKARTSFLRDLGAALAPMNAFLILQGIETLPLRARAHCDNAQRIAEFLYGHDLVTWVNYAGLSDHPDHARAKANFPLGPGAVFGFGLKGGLDAGRRFIDAVQLCSHLANILDAKTLVIHPASTTHQQLSAEEQQAAGVAPDLIRISVGIENANDITADLDQALRASQG